MAEIEPVAWLREFDGHIYCGHGKPPYPSDKPLYPASALAAARRAGAEEMQRAAANVVEGAENSTDNLRVMRALGRLANAIRSLPLPEGE